MSFINSSDVADFETMLSLDNPIKSNVMPRWQRKQQNGEKADRFIPSRSGMDFDNSQNLLMNESTNDNKESDYQKMVANNLIGQDSENKGTRVLAFKSKAPAPKDGYQNSMKILYSANNTIKKDEASKLNRHIQSTPVRILDAPDMLDDYYLNLLSWSSTNVLAVSLAQSVYLWDAASGGITELLTLEDSSDYVCSVSWIQQGGTHLAVGTANNETQLWDVAAGKQVRTMDGHTARVSALSWNSHVLTSASRDTTIVNHDVRIQNHAVSRMVHHTQEVCGLTWSPDGSFLASGANDNTLCIWDAANMHSMNTAPKFALTEHQAAVKALSWSPHERNLLASGGGTADRCIKFWNASSGSLLNSIDTGSQVCALQWSPLQNEILSSHGYAENQLSLWKYPSMARVKDLKGHTSRVLHLATSPDGSMVVSGSADETLRFWNVFAAAPKRKSDDIALTTSGTLKKSAPLKIR